MRVIDVETIDGVEVRLVEFSDPAVGIHVLVQTEVVTGTGREKAWLSIADGSLADCQLEFIRECLRRKGVKVPDRP